MEDQFQYSQSTENSLHISDLGFHAAPPDTYTIIHEEFKGFQKTIDFFFFISFFSHLFPGYSINQYTL